MMLRNYLLTLWLDPVYGVILVVIIVEFGIAFTQILWLLYQSVHAGVLHEKAAMFSKELEPLLLDALKSDSGMKSWIGRARTYPIPIVRTFLDLQVQSIEGPQKDKIIEIYRQVGLLAIDLKSSTSRFWHRRMLAMRRLSLVATDREIQMLLGRKNDRHSVRILAAQILARVGTSFDVFVILKNMRIPRRLMEQPVFMLLNELTFKKLDTLLENFNKFTSQKVQQILLITAARKTPGTCAELLKTAFGHEGMEVRIGACIAAGIIKSQETTALLMQALKDEHWEVRAQAAKALGEYKNAEFIEPLAAMLKDSSFWVRQNAAAGMSLVGDAGLRRLREISETSDDRFARDSAQQELERYELYLLAGGSAA